MDKVIVFERPDDGVGVTYISPKAHDRIEVVPARVEHRQVGTRRVKCEGGKDVLVPVIAAMRLPPVYRQETDDEVVTRTAAAVVPFDCAFIVADAAVVARQDTTFRRAWRLVNSAITVDMPAAREIWRDRIRAARAPMLAALDIEYMRALEVGAKDRAAALAASKQVLRDAPRHSGIDAAQTPDELKRVWPLPE